MMIQRGDRVAFSRKFLNSTGQFTGWAPFARGQVTRLEGDIGGWRLCAVKWDDGSDSHVLDTNLIRESDISREPV